MRANAGSANFVIDRSDDAVFITFSGTQAVASSSGLGRGFFEPVSLYSNTHDIFAPLGRGEEDDDGKPQPMLLQASALRLFMSLYHTSEFQIKEEHENIRLFRIYLKRKDATNDLNTTIETGDLEGIEKYSKRTVKVTKQHNEDCKRLLRLMGAPTIEVLEELRLTMDQFIDLCILSGCDYCDNIKGRAIREA
ncbi:hypothetical protein ZIOFF_021712 [Zingiber officinale]|uniref:Exonuclease 1 n=1 Tax=Zingiber officinale TaxID=94328 RepID=A0A8J5H1V0_ZINOF|nr:hypothetical protein ZIOFF_021712 [Zingiber officinale]